MKNNKLTITYDVDKMSPGTKISQRRVEVLKCKSAKGARKAVNKRNRDYIFSASFTDKDGKVDVIL